MNDSQVVFPRIPTWEGDGSSRVPFWAYTDPEIYRRELVRFFYTGHWCYVGLEAEIPNPGDFKRTSIGERSVILVRDRDGAVNVVENVCAHRGMQFCGPLTTGPIHRLSPWWCYSLKGDLQACR
jgi:salicylate 5-hydroxylase large subunit